MPNMFPHQKQYNCYTFHNWLRKQISWIKLDNLSLGELMITNEEFDFFFDGHSQMQGYSNFGGNNTCVTEFICISS